MFRASIMTIQNYSNFIKQLANVPVHCNGNQYVLELNSISSLDAGCSTSIQIRIVYFILGQVWTWIN
jgi:hypothetical protein